VARTFPNLLRYTGTVAICVVLTVSITTQTLWIEDTIAHCRKDSQEKMLSGLTINDQYLSLVL
jgi:hypothetical protein